MTKRVNGHEDTPSYTLEEYQEKILQIFDIIDIIEMLKLTEEDLVYNFPDRIVNNWRQIGIELGLEEEEDGVFLDFPYSEEEH